MRWMKHVRSCRHLLRRAFDAANRIGDLQYAAYTCNNLNSDLLFAGDPLAEVQREAEHGLAFAQKARFGLAIDFINTQLALVYSLRGLTPKFGSLDGEHIEELRFEQHLSSNPVLAIAECWYWVRKMQARYLAGDYAAAMDASSKAHRLLWTSVSFLEEAEYHFYGALCLAACCDGISSGEPQHLESIAAHHRQLAVWAKNCPENFENRAALVGAEIARLEGRELDAERLYEQAIRLARANAFVHNEAIANELAARFYAARGFETISHAYLRNARYCYLCWGADGKVRQLDQSYPQLKDELPVARPTSTIGAPVEHLDLATVIKVSQAVSGEIVLEKLLDTLMCTAIEQAGAERGLLILSRGAGPRIAAEVTTIRDTVIVHLRDETVTAAMLPESILHFVLRTRESVILDDASAENPFALDPYIRQRHARSLLCLPLLNQAKLIGVLYLENNLAPHVFAPARLAVLKLLASQAATALETTLLYRDLAEREAKIRRLVDANIIGIFIWDFEGRIIEANEALLHMVGHSRDDLVSGRVRWTALTPDEWREADERIVAELRATGSCKAFEKEYFRKDGSRVPVLLGAATFGECRDQGVAFVLDLTERKQAEGALREAQTKLAHVMRITTLGELTASIAHEVNQPLTGVVTYGDACLRWLAREVPQIDRARSAVEQMIFSARHASDVIARIRALSRKGTLESVQLDINKVIQDVIALIRREINVHGVSLRLDLGSSLPPVDGDRIQLQQVVINLLMNGVQAMSRMTGRRRELRIRSREHGSDQILVAVEDSGTGIELQNVDQVFNAFFTTKPDGMGMGLSICRSIIEQHGGRIWANRNSGPGSTFEFTLRISKRGTADEPACAAARAKKD
jgi:PAS domain S-box-containing protein